MKFSNVGEGRVPDTCTTQTSGCQRASDKVVRCVVLFHVYSFISRMIEGSLKNTRAKKSHTSTEADVCDYELGRLLFPPGDSDDAHYSHAPRQSMYVPLSSYVFFKTHSQSAGLFLISCNMSEYVETRCNDAPCSRYIFTGILS